MQCRAKEDFDLLLISSGSLNGIAGKFRGQNCKDNLCCGKMARRHKLKGKLSTETPTLTKARNAHIYDRKPKTFKYIVTNNGSSFKNQIRTDSYIT